MTLHFVFEVTNLLFKHQDLVFNKDLEVSVHWFNLAHGNDDLLCLGQNLQKELLKFPSNLEEILTENNKGSYDKNLRIFLYISPWKICIVCIVWFLVFGFTAWVLFLCWVTHTRPSLDHNECSVQFPSNSDSSQFWNIILP